MRFSTRSASHRVNAADTEDAVRLELLRTLYAQALPTLIVDLVALGGIVLLLASVRAPQSLLLPWAIGVTLAALARYMMTKRFHEATRHGDAWHVWHGGFLGTTLAYAAIWGLAGVYFVVPGSDASLVVVIFLLCGLGAGAVVIYAASLETMLLVLVALFAPFAVNQFYMPASSNHLPLVLALAWAGFGAVLGWRSHQQLLQRIRHEALALRLAGDLDIARVEAERRSSAKSEFLARMNHELRTPLNAIIGFTDIMRNKIFGTVGNATYEGYVDAVHSSGVHLLKLVTDLLDLSKIEAGQTILSKEPNVDMSALVEECLEFLRPDARKAGITLAADSVATLGVADLDPTRIRQMLLNVMTNAVKFSEAGDTVKVICRPTADRIVIAVQDQGCGMPPEKIARALVPFEQLTQDPQRAAKGLGLGLAITKHLVDAHGGELQIDSAEGVGTQVTIGLPRKALDRYSDLEISDTRMRGTPASQDCDRSPRPGLSLHGAPDRRPAPSGKPAVVVPDRG